MFSSKCLQSQSSAQWIPYIIELCGDFIMLCIGMRGALSDGTCPQILHVGEFSCDFFRWRRRRLTFGHATAGSEALGQVMTAGKL